MSSENSDLAMPPLTRRIVTGQDESAQSNVIYDDTDGNIEVFPSGSSFQTLWYTDEVPADCSPATNSDPTKDKVVGLANEGSICRIVYTRPGASSPMHRTQTIDYGVVLEGEIVLELENGDSRVLKAGDVIIQRGTMHAWHNRHATKWAKLLFVLVSSKGEQAQYQ